MEVKSINKRSKKSYILDALHNEADIGCKFAVVQIDIKDCHELKKRTAPIPMIYLKRHTIEQEWGVLLYSTVKIISYYLCSFLTGNK